MKKVFKAVIMLIMVVSILCTSVLAAQDSNAYISSAVAYVHSWGGGVISVEYNVTGTDIMDTIGALRVTVYRAVGDKPDVTKDEMIETYWHEDHPGMMGSDNFVYAWSIKLNVESNQRYYATLGFYATLDGGGDHMAYITDIITA